MTRRITEEQNRVCAFLTGRVSKDNCGLTYSVRTIYYGLGRKVSKSTISATMKHFVVLGLWEVVPLSEKEPVYRKVQGQNKNFLAYASDVQAKVKTNRTRRPVAIARPPALLQLPQTFVELDRLIKSAVKAALDERQLSLV